MLTESSRQADFPSLDRMIYLNTAAEGIPPRAVNQALQQYAANKAQGMDGRPLHEAQWNDMRRIAGQMLGLGEERIGICSSSSEAFNLASAALRLTENDEVIINELDFPSGITPWLPPISPARTRLWRSRRGALEVDDLRSLLSPRTRVVSLSLVSFYNGFRAQFSNVVDVVRRSSDAAIIVDVTQALGRIPIDVSGADLVIGSTYKWTLGIHSGALVGLPRSEQRWTVPCGGWFNLQNAFDSNRFECAVPKVGAASFCAGMPNYAAVYANRAALEYIQGVGVGAIKSYASPLMQACLEGLKTLDVELLTPSDAGCLAGILAFRHSRAEHIHAYLQERNIHVMHNAGRLRVAVHGYNTLADVEQFLSTLHEALRHG